MTLTVISYYTQDWIYPKYAESLQQDCERLGLNHIIKEMPSSNNYVGNCNIKPNFIRDQLLNLKSPVLWMDVDGSILSLPDILMSSDLLSYDIAANQPVGNSKRIHVGSIWFNYTNPVLEFINAWVDKVQGSIDDAAFNGVWAEHKNKLNVLLLPEKYFFIHKTNKQLIPSDTVIVHRLSNSDLKWAYKNKVERK